MNKTINIGTTKEVGDNEVFTGENFEKFLRNLPPMSDEEVLRIRNSTINILSNCISSNFKEESFEQNTGLVLGYIQSGKTMSFTSLIALASDNEYKIIIVLAGTTNILLDQTIERLTEDLKDKDEYVIIQEANISKASRIASIMNNPKRNRTIVIPILKHYQHIDRINQLFTTPKLNLHLSKLGVLIIDDEADQASLNGFASRNYKLSKKNNIKDISDENERSDFKFSTTYNKISELKAIIPNHSFIQYTATPQANLLLGQRDLLRPSWCEVLSPGDKYTGGKRFFNPKLDLITEIDKENIKNQTDPEMPENLRHAFRLFLIESALLCYSFDGKNRIKNKLKITSMMVHADRLISVNDYYLSWLKNYLNNIIQDLRISEDEILEDFKKIFDLVSENLGDYFDVFPKFEQVMEKIQYYVLEEIELSFVGGKEDFTNENWNRCKHHVLVGGQKLDRGFTVKNLIVTYMPRTTKSKSNADTIEQRCRFFGYKKDYIEACKVYIPQESINEFEEYVEYEKHLRNLLKNYSLDEFYDNDRLMKLGILNPTSRNKIPGELFRNNFRNFNYLQPDFDNKDHNDLITNKFLDSSLKLGVLMPRYFANDQKDNKHLLFETTNQKVLDLLTDVRFNSNKEQVTKSQLLDVLKNNDPDQKVLLNKHHPEVLNLLRYYIIYQS